MENNNTSINNNNNNNALASSSTSTITNNINSNNPNSNPVTTTTAPTTTATTTTTNNNNSTNTTSSTNNNMISLKVRLVDSNIVKTLQFNPSTIVYDALKIIREKIPETNTTNGTSGSGSSANTNNTSNYGIFIPNNDPSKGTWLENARSLEYYLLKNGDTIDYCNKFRKLNIKILDGQKRSLMVDDSQTVGQLMIYICSQMGIANYEEYSLINEITDSDKDKTLTLKKQQEKTLNRDYKKMEELKKKLHTDDDIPWLDHSKTLRQQFIDENSTLILKRKFFFSDKNIDTRDPVQLNLLYIQCRDAIINGTHPITEEEAIKFAAMQCQVKFGDYNDSTHKSGCLDLKEYLPKEYIKVKGIEKKIFQEYKTNLVGLKELDAKLKYTQLCRSLKTYGVTFFLVKEKMKGKNKLVARLLGITKESIVRVDEKTKEFINVYPLECVKKWAASPNTFTLDFGDHYKEPYYSMQTTEGEHIARLISGYIDIILKKKKAKEILNNDMNDEEESPMLEEVISPSKATVIQMNKTNINQVVTGNVVLPGILRNGQEANSFSSGSIVSQNSDMSRQAHIVYTSAIVNNNQAVEYQQHTQITNGKSQSMSSLMLPQQKPLITTIQHARGVINKAQLNLHQRTIIQNDIGNDPASIQWKTNMIDVNRQNVTSHLSAMNAATAQVVTLTSNGPQNTDFNAVGAAVSCISTNLGDFSKDVMTIVALQQDENPADSDNLLDAAKKLCFAFTDFLRYVEPDCSEPRQNLFSAVGKIGEAGNEIIRTINKDDANFTDANEPKLQDSFIGLAKCVASSTAGLVIASKNVANHCENQQGVNEVISLVTQCALSTSQLVSCTKVCASTIESRECQEQIVEAARQVSRQVDAVMEVANYHCQDEQALNELKKCARNVTETVIQLLDNVKASNDRMMNISSVNYNNNRDRQSTTSAQKQDESIDKIFQATENLFNSMGDASEMIKQAKILAQATTDLINSLKQDAHVQQTSDQQRRLLLAAKLLAEATTKIVEAAKGCATNPNDEKMQINLRKAAEDLKNATTLATGDNLQMKIIKRLSFCAKQAASCATQSIAAIQVCTLYNPAVNNGNSQQDNLINGSNDMLSSISNDFSGSLFGDKNQRVQSYQVHNELIQQCKQVADLVPKIVQGIRGCLVAPSSKSAHLGLVSACEDFLLPTQKMINLTKAVLPTIVDEIKAIQLRNCTNQLANAMADLKSCLARTQEVCGSFEAEAMIESIKILDKELLEVKKAALASTLKPLPGETLEACEAQLAAVSKTVGLSMAQMLTASAQSNEVYTGIASKDTLNSLRSLTNSIRAIAACSSNSPTYQEKLIESARIVLHQSIQLVNEAKLALNKPNESVQNQQRLAQIARSIAQSLYECVNCLPGQKDIDEVIKTISEFSSVLFNDQNGSSDVNNFKFPSTNKSLPQLQTDLNQAALKLNNATNQIVIDSRKGSQHLSQSTYRFSGAFGSFLQNSLSLAGQDEIQDQEKSQIVNTLRDVYANSSKLLQSAKACVADPNAANCRQQLTIAVKQVTESINSVINLCNVETNNPVLSAQKECDNALRDIETTRTIIQTSHHYHSDNESNKNYTDYNSNAEDETGSNTSDGSMVIIREPPPINNNSRLNELNGQNCLASYYDCLDQIIEKSRTLGESMTGIANSCKNPGSLQLFCKSIKETSKSVCGLVETAAHSAYIIGVSDIESKPGRQAILDTGHFINCSQRIQDICLSLQSLITNANNGQDLSDDHRKQLIHAATQIAHNTASLCNASQAASNKTNNILAKRHFVQSAKQVANTTAHFVKSIKSLDASTSSTTSMSGANQYLTDFSHETYTSLVKPLIESVESLCQYALSSEFASLPAQISENGAKAQQPILRATRTMLDASSQLIKASRCLISNNKDPQSWQSFSNNSKMISESIKRLATSIKEKAPAKVECDQALAIIDKCMKSVENTLLAMAMNQTLELSEAANNKSLQTYQEHAISCANQIMELVDQVRVSAKGQADKLAHLVTDISQYFEPLVVNVIGCAMKTPFNNQLQTAYLEQTKTVLESTYQLMLASKESAGNPKNTSNLHQTIDENADGTKEVLDDLIQTLEEATAQNGYVSSMVDNITKAIDKVDINIQNKNSRRNDHENMIESENQILFVEYQTKICQYAKMIQQNIKDMSICNVTELGQYAQQLTQTFNSLIMSCKGLMNTTSINDSQDYKDLYNQIKITSQELGKSCISLVSLAGRLQNNSKDKMLKKELLEQIDVVYKNVNNLLYTFKTSEHAKSTQACINADNSVNSIIADLNTVIMFATAGTLKSEHETDTFSNHRESILRSAKTLVEDTKSLVSTCGQQQNIDQDQLARGVQTSVRTITKLSDAVKLGAASLGSDQPDAQILLINSVKDVASALSDLILAIKMVSRNSSNNQSYSASMLTDSAKNMITNVQSLLKTVKTVEDEAARGTRALESSIEAIYQEIKSYSSLILNDETAIKLQDLSDQDRYALVSTNPEDLISATKQITLATSKAISAANSLRQEDVISAANMGRKAVSDLLYISSGKNITHNGTHKNTNKLNGSNGEAMLNGYQQQVLSVSLNCAVSFKELLECIQSIFNKNSNADSKHNLLNYSNSVAGSVSEMIQLTEILKGSENTMENEDINTFDENELLGAVNEIESAAEKLSILKPRSKTETLENDNLNFDEQILESAKSITNAAGLLIKSATAAQKELISQGKFKPINSNLKEENGQWSQGLISAARMVAAACHTLCEAANGLVQGHGTEERLISSAKQVASSTAALLVACKVKSDLTSQAMKRLQHAGNAIKRATDALVRAAQQAVDINEEDQFLELNTKFVGSMAQEIMLREEILRKERELKAAQAAYNAVKKARYQREENSPSSTASNSNSSGNNSNAESQSSKNTVFENQDGYYKISQQNK